MIGRRLALKGLMGMGMYGGLPAQRLDQQYRPEGQAPPVGSRSGIFRGRLVVISGSSANGSVGLFVYSPVPGPGNLVASIAAVAGTDPFGNAFKRDIASYSPSGNSVQMTANDVIWNSVAFPSPAVATLIASAITGSLIGQSGAQTGADTMALTQLLSAAESSSGAAQMILSALASPFVIPTPATTALLEVQGSAAVAGPLTATGGTAASPTLVQTDTWHSLGALGAHYAVTLGRYRLTPDNEVELDILVSGDGLQATSVTFANTLPAKYRPATSHNNLPMGTNHVVTAGDVWPRLSVDTAGNVTVTNQGTANAFAACVRVPLD